jgi:phosphate transport system substrate-binding protein
MRIRTPVAVAIAALVFTATTAAGAIAAKTITMSGSTSIAPLATKLAKAYVRKSSGVRFVILRGGSDIGIDDAARGRVTIGMSSRDPKPADPGGIRFRKFARDAVCVVSNPDNRLPNLSRSQIQDIFSGRVRNWAQVSGSTVNGPIRLIVRTAASGTQDAFQQIFMGQSLRVAGSAQTKSSNGLQAQAIKADPQAIGYASFNFTKGLHNIPYRGVPCTLRNAKSGEYGGTRNFWWVVRPPEKKAARKFINFTRKSRAAQKIIAKRWVPLR